MEWKRGRDGLHDSRTDPVRLAPAQSYRIERDGAKVRVIGGDAAGAMYGRLDVAEAVRLGTLAVIAVGERKPHIEFRGIKFNIPLDVRTPSYSDNATAFQANIPEMWSRVFWGEFLDEMARHRYNVLSLWNLHPFPSIVKVPEFPDVALNDILRAKPEHFDENISFKGGSIRRSQSVNCESCMPSRQYGVEERKGWPSRFTGRGPRGSCHES